MVEMGRTRRLKRVSWAPGVNLCQVRLFLSEDAPCKSGLSSQDHLQAKDSWTMHASTGSTSDDSPLPPGFESVHSQNRPKTDISKIPLIRWKCPPKIVLNPEWYVVSGEESKEIAKQNQRTFGVLEAIYPRQSTIPPNPSISAEAQESHCDDSLIHLVPLTAIEDDDPSDQFDSQSVQSEPSPIVSNQSNSVLHPTTAPPPAQIPPSNVSPGPTLADMSKMLSRLGSHADVAAATAAAITALTSAEQGNLIDQNLLIKILSDPSLIAMLLTSENQKPNPKPPQPATASMPLSAPLPVPPPSPPQHSAQLFNSANDPNPRATRPVVPTTTSGPLPPQPMHHNVPLFNSMRNTNANPRPPQPMVINTVSASLPPPPPPRPHMIPQFSSVRTTMVGSVATPPPPPPPPPQMITTSIRSSASVTPAKDASYYLSLIKQHGGDNLGSTNSLIKQHGGENLGSTKSLIKQHGGENLGSTNPDVTAIGASAVQFKGQQHGFSGTCEGTKSKMKKTCAFYNTARGCRHGDSCSYLHENSINSKDERAKKRVKLHSNGIVGRI